MSFKITWPTGLVEIWHSVETDIQKFIDTHWGTGVDPSTYGVKVEEHTGTAVPTAAAEPANVAPAQPVDPTAVAEEKVDGHE
jgi:hypothetical protein